MSAIRTTLLVAAASSALLVAAAEAGEPGADPNSQVRVFYDQNTLVRLDRPAKTVIVGNPSIADVQFIDPSTIYLVGRMFGNTNVIAIDSNGAEVLNTQVTVTGPDVAQVTVYRGPNGQRNLACAPHCERTLTQGDPDMDALAQNHEKKTSVAEKAAELSGRGH